MTDKLEAALAPHERMAEIRRLVRDIEAVRADGARLDAAADALGIGHANELEELLFQANEAWCKHGDMVVLLFEHLNCAEARGELGECEGMLSVSYAGRV